MTTNPTPIPEPTSPTAVVVAKLVASPKTQTALIALHNWAAVHDHQLHDLLERHEDLCLGMGLCDRSGVES